MPRSFSVLTVNCPAFLLHLRGGIGDLEIAVVRGAQKLNLLDNPATALRLRAYVHVISDS